MLLQFSRLFIIVHVLTFLWLLLLNGKEMIFRTEMEGLFKDGNIIKNCTFMIIHRFVYKFRAP